MSDRGVWNERPPGTEDDILPEYYKDNADSRSQHSSVESKKRPSPSPHSKGFYKGPSSQGHGFSRRGNVESRSESREDYSRNRIHRHSRSPTSKVNPSPSRGKSSRRNRRSYSSSSGDSSRSSSSSSRNNSKKYRKRTRSRSRTRTTIKENDGYKKKIQENRGRYSRSSSNGSTDSNSSRKRKHSRQYTSSNDRRSGNPHKSYRVEPRGNPSSTRYPRMTQQTSALSSQRQGSFTVPKSQTPSLPQFKNDGSFLEMFKKMQEAQKSADSSQSTSTQSTSTQPSQPEEMKKPVAPFVGKRRGGRVLKTGMVKKAKTIEEQTVDNNPIDAWSLYLQEVKKYRETSCEEEGKTRPLVK